MKPVHGNKRIRPCNCGCIKHGICSHCDPNITIVVRTDGEGVYALHPEDLELIKVVAER